MGFLEHCKSLLLQLSLLFPSSLLHDFHQQPVLSDRLQAPLDNVPQHYAYPEFPAPNGPEYAGDFNCTYPALGDGWSKCSTSRDRSCWLKGPNGGKFDINTDYENSWPPGITREVRSRQSTFVHANTRKYYLEVDEMPINGDGVTNPDGKVFNQTYPGPWIQACWGDIIKVTVKNKLKKNGTTIHWHGIRQLNTTEMDGVNGVTQCPISTNDEYVYTFRATQYGTSWYHSHYSLQYADGLHGPLTIYGPSSAPYDEARDPLIITDWNHRSAFKDWQRELVPVPSIPKMNSVLINGKGNFAGAFAGKKFEMTVGRGKKYLLRIINTSVDTTYIFSIDNHNFTVMTTDFVPIHPYTVDHIAVGIGQRYHIVLNADPLPINGGGLSDDGNYWIRVIPADGCKGFEIGNEPDERQGVLRYNASSIDVPTSFRRQNMSLACRDEPHDRLSPIHPWNVTPIELSAASSGNFSIGKDSRIDRPAKSDNFTWWSFGDKPLWLNFSNPTLLNLHNTTWNPDYVVIPADYEEDAWVYLVVTASRQASNTGSTPGRSFIPVAHPMHLHGHDFALLAQGNDASDLRNGELTLKWDNPPRRDVALLPMGGYLVIAFRADNPGAWLFHCHIPWHASSGLALQILERQSALEEMMNEERLKETRRVCGKWDTWLHETSKHWNASAPFQDDSGI